MKLLLLSIILTLATQSFAQTKREVATQFLNELRTLFLNSSEVGIDDIAGQWIKTSYIKLKGVLVYQYNPTGLSSINITNQSEEYVIRDLEMAPTDFINPITGEKVSVKEETQLFEGSAVLSKNNDELLPRYRIKKMLVKIFSIGEDHYFTFRGIRKREIKTQTLDQRIESFEGNSYYHYCRLAPATNELFICLTKCSDRNNFKSCMAASTYKRKRSAL